MCADMTGAAIKELIDGKTVYVELTEASFMPKRLKAGAVDGGLGLIGVG